MIKKLLQRVPNWIIEIIFWSCMLVVLYTAGQVFFFASFMIPSASMSPGLVGDDYALIWKPVIGARLFNLFDAAKGEKVDIYRMLGVRNVRRNDVLNSRDSRYWGLLPEDLIVGKAAFIWKSVDPHTGKYRWKRFFKAVK